MISMNWMGLAVRVPPPRVIKEVRLAGGASYRPLGGAGGSATPASRQALVNDAPRPSTAPPRGYGECSTRNKVVRILSEAPRAISPRMRRSFIDRQYSPLTNMD
jgi:hypothetical protein